jgi:hypothetical protein
VLVIVSAGLLAAVGAVFTQVIAARVPEQRATLEKLITDRTGLEVRFDNVHLSWGLNGTSAVFERVELTDPVRGRVRVVAPELRVEFDAWDYLRHQQFSLGHVTLKSPDIEITGDAEPSAAALASAPSAGRKQPAGDEDEAARVRRFTAWAELMPMGRVEVEGARVHLFRRGERKARHDFTLSQAVISRGSHNFTAFGTMLLSQDIGQSLFVSAKLTNLGAAGGVEGELRLIARRVFLDKLASLLTRHAEFRARGRGTIDARFALRAGRLHQGSWQMSARELELPRGSRFDHFTVHGKLSRASQDVHLEFTDLQLTRGARLERAPRLDVDLRLAPGTTRVVAATLQSERIPFMAAEFLAGAFASRVERPLAVLPPDWAPTAGELRSVRFDSRGDSFSAQVAGAEISRGSDQARVSQLAARLEVVDGRTSVLFDESSAVRLILPGTGEPRELRLSGAMAFHPSDGDPELDFTALRVRSGDASVLADGRWGAGQPQARPLMLAVAQVDLALLGDVWNLLALDAEYPQLDDLRQGRIVAGQVSLQPGIAPDGRRIVNWQRSRGSLELAELASAGEDLPRLESAAGKLEFSRGGSRLRLTTGRVEDLQLSAARIDWPRGGAPRLQASLQGELQSPLLQRVLAEHGLEKLTGAVQLEAEARGDAELRAPDTWRVTARLSDASMPLPDGLPRVEALAGTVRLAGGQLRGLALTGRWLGGSVAVESRRAGARGVTSAGLQGEADAARLLELLGQPGVRQVGGTLAWSGSLQRESGRDGWRLALSSNLAGVESRLPQPFDKARARQIPVSAELKFDARGIREFDIDSGRDQLRGRVQNGLTTARFDVQGVAGEWLSGGGDSDPRLRFEALDLRRAPAVLVVAGALLPADTELAVHVAELRHASRGLGALEAGLARRAGGVEFTLESAAGSPHELSATGHCAADEGRCRMEFALDTRQLPDLLAGSELPAEWPTQMLRASGDLAWRADGAGDIARQLSGNFEIETQGADSSHQLMASATLGEGQIELVNIQGTGPEQDQVFRGNGRVRLAARTYDLSLDYEKVSLAASAVPTPARARLARAWTSLRGSAARRGWTEELPARRVQWHGSWSGDITQSPD